jgi:pimeloyl-ACP methyl ester carboxylesterase
MIASLRSAGFVELQHRTGDVSLNYARGPRNGPPLVLIAGQTIPWQSYQRVLPQLSHHFWVFAVDIRGHGKSTWTPGAYTLDTIGNDLVSLLRTVVAEPAIISGNSSGGLIAVWLAANVPELVRAIAPEDPPLFSSEMPRFREDCYVYKVFKLCAETADTAEGLDLAKFFARFEVPVQGKKHVMRMPKFIGAFISAYVRIYQKVRPHHPVDIPFLPLGVRIFLKGLSMFDPSFSRAFLDGSAQVGFDHTATLARVTCPILLIHANWFRHEKHGLVGALDDDDVRRVRSLVRDFRYLRVNAGHMVHLEKPQEFIRAMLRFSSAL